MNMNENVKLDHSFVARTWHFYNWYQSHPLALKMQ